MDLSVAWRAALLQGAAVATLAVLLGAALPRSFFEDAGWLAGPGAWAVCAALCAVVLRLPLVPTLAGAAAAGLPSLAGVLLGEHWLGAPLVVILFGLWCGRLARRDRARPMRRSEATA
jgi:hypothetical protein